MNNFQSVFYDIDNLQLDERKRLLQLAFDKADSWHVDILDCAISMARSRTSYTFKEIMKIFRMDSHMVVINRNFPNSSGEIGFSNSSNTSGVAYFLFIELTEEKLKDIITEFKLKAKKY